MKARAIKEIKFNISENKAKKLTFILIGAALLCLLVFLLIIFLNPQSYKAVTYSLDTYVVQTVYGDNAEAVAEEAADAAASVEDLLSFDGENSEIALINENAGNVWTKLSGATYNVLDAAIRMCEITNGDFDITLAPVSRLYRFDDESFTVPSDEFIKKYINNVDYKELRIDSEENSASFAHFGYAADISHILTGAACDAVTEVYLNNGITSAAVIIGDSIGIVGAKPGNEKWEVVVNTPENDGELGIIRIDKGFISTVSKYENYCVIDGKEYHDIIDPKTGYPVNNNLESVTVISGSGLESNALAYALFVKGYSDSLELLKELDAFAIFVFDDNTVRIYGETGIFKLTNESYKQK